MSDNTNAIEERAREDIKGLLEERKKKVKVIIAIIDGYKRFVFKFELLVPFQDKFGPMPIMNSSNNITGPLTAL